MSARLKSSYYHLFFFRAAINPRCFSLILNQTICEQIEYNDSYMYNIYLTIMLDY